MEYKFIVMREDRKGEPIWEEFPGNRSITAAVGTFVTARSMWNKEDSTTLASLPLTSETPEKTVESKAEVALTVEEKNLARQKQEDMLVQMAEAGVEAAAAEVTEACPLAVTIADREPMRRNFSQSLFTPRLFCAQAGPREQPSDAKEAAGKEEAGEEAGQPLQGMPLKHISSFSALTEMLDAEQKTEGRKGSKAQSHYDPYNIDVPIVIVTSEIAPWSKTGGLGMVAASYAYEFARNGHRTMAVSPKYRHYEGITYIGETKVWVDNREECVKYWHRFIDSGDGRGCDYVFVEHSSIERAGGLYNGDDGREYQDNLFRFTLLSMAAMEAPLILNIGGRGTYGDKVLFLANDWQSGLVPLLLSYKYRRHSVYAQARAIYVIHNLGYQGQYHNVNASAFFGIDREAASDIALGNAINLTKGALICADRVLTVSPNYAQEIQTPQGGFKLQDFVRAKAHGLRLGGILNGIDDCWNPEVDSNVVRTYSIADFESGKRTNKAALQKALGLEENPDLVLLGFVGRLTWQKGVDVLGSVISWMMADAGNGVTGNAQLIMMGNGEKQHAETLKWAEESFKGRVCGYVGFDPKVEHQMMAGCDLFIMPSRYEPCGLPQMYSQQYGTLPIVTSTGGLVDSVRDISEGFDTATGFLMPHLAADKMKEVLYKAMELYHKRPTEFRCMQRTAMSTDFYWPKAMDEYERMIDITLYDPATVR